MSHLGPRISGNLAVLGGTAGRVIMTSGIPYLPPGWGLVLEVPVMAPRKAVMAVMAERWPNKTKVHVFHVNPGLISHGL